MLQASGSPSARCRTAADVQGPTPGSDRRATSVLPVYALLARRSSDRLVRAAARMARVRRASTLERRAAGSVPEPLEEQQLRAEGLLAGHDLLDRGRRQRLEDKVRTAETQPW